MAWVCLSCVTVVVILAHNLKLAVVMTTKDSVGYQIRTCISNTDLCVKVSKQGGGNKGNEPQQD